MRKNKTILTVIATVLATSLLWVSAYNIFIGNNPVVKKVADAYRIIDRHFILDFDENYSKDFTVAALVASLGDPYSQYFPEDYYDKLTESMSGHYYGIGVMMSVGEDESSLTVTEVNEGSPAEKAGILPGDVLVMVGDIKVSAENYEQAISLVKGEENDKGSEVKLTLVRGTSGVEYSVWVKREKIVNHTVQAEILEPGIAYIKISSFDNETQTEFLNRVEELGADNIKGLVLDLRDNGGGTLFSVRAVADMLMPEAVLTTFKYKSGKTTDIHTNKEQLITAPICVIVNGGSASASEVLSSALRDNGRAKLVGEQTFGKAIAQKSVPFETAKGEVVSSIYLTYASYLTPCGDDIHGVGLKPDFLVETPGKYVGVRVEKWERSEDIQLEKAIEVLKNDMKKSSEEVK